MSVSALLLKRPGAHTHTTFAPSLIGRIRPYTALCVILQCPFQTHVPA